MEYALLDGNNNMNLLIEANRLSAKLATDFKNLILENSTQHKIIAIYSEKFEPFHKSHFAIYNLLVNKFGKDNVFIVTTEGDKDSNESMKFDDKKTVIESFPIKEDVIQKVDNPYVPVEILKKFNPEQTSFVIVIPEQIVGPLSKSKYFHRYVEGTRLQPYKVAGYFISIPEIKAKVGKQNLSEPQIMQIIGSEETKPEIKKELIKHLYGKENETVLKTIEQAARANAKELDGSFVHSAEDTFHKQDKPEKTQAKGIPSKAKEQKPKKKKNPMSQMIQNPDTGRKIQVRSALKYPRWKPVYKKAERFIQTVGIDRKDRVKDPEVNRRYRSRAKNINKESLAIDLGQLLAMEIMDNVNESDIKNLFEEKKTPIAIYSGRFQPFHSGHYYAYEALVKKFGKDNVYIATSDKTEPGKSPFNFDDKQKIITKMFGVNPSHVVKVSNPYKATEITSQFSPDTPVVWGVGEKDAERLAQSKYFKPFNDTKDTTDGYEQHGYVMTVPQLPLTVRGQTISGTAVRNVFTNGTPEEKKELFTTLYGKFNPDIFSLISNKIEHGTTQTNTSSEPQKTTSIGADKKHAKLIQYLKDKIKNPETGNDIQVGTALKYDPQHPAHKAAKQFLHSKNVVTESILLEGGAYGHLLHPYEDMDLTFGDLKEMAKRALGTGLEKEGPVVEKTDGQNIMFTVRDGQIRFARSTKHLKNSGEHAMTTDELKQMFAGRGNIEKTFGSAGEDLQSAVDKLGPETVHNIFSNGRKFMSVEIIHPDSENTIPYGKNMLVLHHTVTFDDNGKPIDHTTEDSDLMADELRKIEADKQKEFGIRGQQFIVFDDKDSEKLKSKTDGYIHEIDILEQEFGLNDNATIGDYKKLWWKQRLDRVDVPLSDQDKQLLMSRWGSGDKSNRLTNLSSPQIMQWAKKIEPMVDDLNRKAIYPLQSFVARIGVDSLARATDLLSANNPEAGQIIRDKLAKAIQTIKNSGDPDKISEMDHFMKLIDDIGLDRIMPSEGLLFQYGGKLYKFTGAFAPVHRIIGAVKFAKERKSNPAPPTEKPMKSKTTIKKPQAQSVSPEKIKKASNVLNKRIKNPETGNDILIKTALKYDKGHPVYKTAAKLMQKEIISEGGHAVPTNSKIPNQFASSTTTNALDKLGLSSVNHAIVGSTHKPLMNDLDVATDENEVKKIIGYDGNDKKEFFSKLKSYLDSKGVQTSISPGFNQFSVSVPLVDNNGKPQPAVNPDGGTGKESGTVQVDFMIGNVSWMKQYLTNGDKSQFSSTYRNILTANILSNMIFETDERDSHGLPIKYKFQINTRTGLEKAFFTEHNGKRTVIKKEPVSSNPDDVAKLIFGKDASFSDINTFEKLNNEVHSSKFPLKDKVEGIYKEFAHTLEKMSLDIPDSIKPPETGQVYKRDAIDPYTKVKNPETGNDILVKTALGYEPDHPARKAAEKALGKF